MNFDMKTIALIVAMSKELKLLLPLMEDVETVDLHGTTFHSGRIGGHRIVAMECGIGKVNAAMGTTLLLDEFNPDLVINTGVAAGAGDGVAVMDVVVADGVAHHDFWCIGEEWGRVPGSPRILPTVVPQALRGQEHVKTGLICSGELFISRREEIDTILGHFPAALAVDMESAAVGQVCFARGVPFICMRLISDTPWCDHDNSRQYDDFWSEAPAHSFALVEKLIQSL